jgi:DNA-binding transcriptional ArsR family regulator
MARSATTTDVFNAVGEAQRRDILDLLAGGERSVNELVDLLKTRQPQVSKHLKVLKEVGLVSVRVVGQQRLYKLNPEAVKPVHDWVKPFERLWNERLDRLDEYLTELQKGEAKNDKKEAKPNGNTKARARLEKTTATLEPVSQNPTKKGEK